MWGKAEALKAVEAGKVLVGKKTSQYPGEEAEYLPQEQNTPDFYAWHVKGRPDSSCLSVLQLEVQE